MEIIPTGEPVVLAALAVALVAALVAAVGLLLRRRRRDVRAYDRRQRALVAFLRDIAARDRRGR